MSLFGDLPALGTALGGAQHGPSPAPVTHSILKKPAAIAPPPSILRSKKRKAGEEPSGSAAATTGNDGHGLFAPFGPIQDEYDPAVPNEYEKAKQAQEEAVLEADRAARLAAQDRESGAQPESAEDANDSGDGFEQRAGLGSSGAGQGSGAMGSSVGTGGLSVAEKLMKGMGWTAGQGLGKEKQGISTPFILQKTDTRTGVIVNAQPLHETSTQGAAQNEGTPTNIVLLKNMIGAGEVDDGLEDEVAEEVSKFGEVFRVMIFEVSGVPVAPHQAVRIFVEMDKIQSAQQAVSALNGRYFDQKMISASFFDEQRFEAMDLAPTPDELK